MALFCLKVTLPFFLFFNLILFILGGLILGCGMWILTDRSPFGTIMYVAAPPFKLVMSVFVVVGAVSMAAGLVACAGACFGIRLLLWLYVATLLTMMAAQVATGANVFGQREEVLNRTAETILIILLTYDPEDEVNRTMETAWDNVQHQYKCCGWTGPNNWLINAALRKKNYNVYPCSCTQEPPVPLGFCPPKPDPSAEEPMTPDKWPVVELGCFEGLQTTVAENVAIILVVCLALALTELIS